MIVLKDRVLWRDGRSSYHPSRILEGVFQTTTTPFVTEITSDVERFNEISDTQLEVRTEDPQCNTDWCCGIDAIDVRQTVVEKLENYLRTYEGDHTIPISRVMVELQWFEEQGMFPMLAACIVVVNKLHETNTVWGVGRGSTVASFVLFLIEMHDIDPLRFNLPFEELTGE